MLVGTGCHRSSRTVSCCLGLSSNATSASLDQKHRPAHSGRSLLIFGGRMSLGSMPCPLLIALASRTWRVS